MFPSCLCFFIQTCKKCGSVHGGIFYRSVFCLHDLNVQRGLKRLRKMELNMYSVKNYTEEKGSVWLQKTDGRNIQKGYLSVQLPRLKNFDWWNLGLFSGLTSMSSMEWPLIAKWSELVVGWLMWCWLNGFLDWKLNPIIIGSCVSVFCIAPFHSVTKGSWYLGRE